MARLFKKGKTAFASSVLNILGLTAAFAALYIILVQVHHDLTYNKALKDSDRIYVLTQREINQSGYSSYTKGTNNDPTYYANGETLRVYYGSTFTFSVSEGYEIVAVGLSIETDDSNSKIKDFSVLEWTNAETEVLMNSCVASAIDGNEDVSFYVTGTGGHLRFTQISVVYRVVE